jgi:hypothetical protein
LTNAHKFLETKVTIRILRIQALQQVGFRDHLQPVDLEDLASKSRNPRRRGFFEPVEEVYKRAIRRYLSSMEPLRQLLLATEPLVEQLFTHRYDSLNFVDSFLRDLPEQHNPVYHQRYLASSKFFIIYDQVQALRSKLARGQERNDLDAVDRLQAAVKERLRQLEDTFRGLDVPSESQTPERFLGRLHRHILEQQQYLMGIGIAQPGRQALITSYFQLFPPRKRKTSQGPSDRFAAG